MGAWTSPNTRSSTCLSASSGRSSPTPARARTTSKPCGAGAMFCASSNHSRWQAERDHPSEQYEPGGIGDASSAPALPCPSPPSNVLGLLWMFDFERLQPPAKTLSRASATIGRTPSGMLQWHSAVVSLDTLHSGFPGGHDG